MQKIAFIAVIALVGCRDYHDPSNGTSVGNPGKEMTRIAPGKDLVITSARAVDGRLSISGCDEDDGVQVTLYDDEGSLDLLASDAVDLPAGLWCSLTVDLPTIEIDASGDAGGTALIDLTTKSFEIYLFELEVTEDTKIVVQLGSPGWLDATTLGLPADVAIIGGSPEHEALTDLLYLESGAYRDDGDGLLDDEEQAESVGLSNKDKWQNENKDGDTGLAKKSGCSTTGSGPSAWWFLVLAIATRSRQTRS